MKILITGCAGFIGSHTCEQLLKNGNIILGIDNLNDYYSIEQKETNLEILKKYSNFTFLKEDIRNTKEILNWHPDTVLHLAAMAGVRYSLENPQLYSDININGFINILEQCKLINCKLVYASSSSVYGLNTKVPFSEEDTIEKCNSPYACSKRAKEIYAQMYSQVYNLSTIGLRFFTVYGPRGRPDMAPYKFLNKISNEISIDKYGNGTSSRDYTYISDIVSGIISAINCNKKCEIYNLGNSNPVSLNEFIKTCEEVTGKSAIINQMDEQMGDVPHTYADISKAKKDLGYCPKVCLKEGLEKCINKNINVIIQFYSIKNNKSDELLNKRQNELLFCLKKNIEYCYIDTFHILLENYKLDLQEIIDYGIDITNPKLVIVNYNKRMIYSNAFEYANEYLNNKICVLLHTDIFLLSGFDKIKESELNNTLYALARTSEYKGEDTDNGTGIKIKQVDDLEYCTTIDGWCFKTPILEKIIKKSTHQQNVWGAENRLIWIFKQNDYKVYTPRCLKMIHWHKTDTRPWANENNNWIKMDGSLISHDIHQENRRKNKIYKRLICGADIPIIMGSSQVI